MIQLDTHVVVWLYDGRTDLFPKKTMELMEKEELGVSPMVILELEYLFETRKISRQSHLYISDLSDRIGLSVLSDSFGGVVSQAVLEKWTRDPFDRIIAAHAALNNSKLVTKDRAILKHYAHAVWGGK
ncbi:MAG: PIN domain-containing protein [Deltaproteobacteria bacterium]|nr:PIN domain-containing protein [Deltaproteobacteria bacterium]